MQKPFKASKLRKQFALLEQEIATDMMVIAMVVLMVMVLAMV